MEEGGPCHHKTFQPRIWLGCSIYPPWGSAKLRQVCIWKGNAPCGCQLGDNAMDICWQERWPCPPAGRCVVWRRPPEMFCPSSCWLTSSLASGLLGRATGQGVCLGSEWWLFAEHLLCTSISGPPTILNRSHSVSRMDLLMDSRGPEVSLQVLPHLLEPLVPTAPKCRLSVSVTEKETGAERFNSLSQVPHLRSGKGRI